MAQWSAASGNAGRLYLQVDELQVDPWGNSSLVRVQAFITISGTTYSGYATAWSVSGSWNWSGTFTMPGSGNRTFMLLDTSFWTGRNPDGSALVTLTASIGATNTIGMGGPTSVTGQVWLQQLNVPPGTPTNVRAYMAGPTTSVLNWSNNYQSNGVPTVNNVAASVNNGGWATILSVGATDGVIIGNNPNQKIQYMVGAGNGAGWSSNSAASNAVFTVPAAPTNVVATKQPNNDILITWQNNVGFSEYVTVLERGVVNPTTDDVTWQGSPATLASGVTQYLNTPLNPAEIHTYRIYAHNADGSFNSATAYSNAVQLQAPPNAPTVTPLPASVDRTQAFRVDWAHNTVDTSAQTQYQLRFSLDGGTTWTELASVASSDQFAMFGPLGGQPLGQTIQIQVRTWGAATTGGSLNTGNSPWSSSVTTTTQTAPVATIIAPANGSVVETSSGTWQIGFTGAGGATLVRTNLTLSLGGTVIETVQSTSTTGRFTTRLADGSAYTVTATVLDSHGLTSAPVTATFTVDYAEPATPEIAATYERDSGSVSLRINLPADLGGRVPPVTITVERVIDGVVEYLAERMPWDGTPITFVDPVPLTYGLTTYRVIGYSFDGAATPPAVAVVAANDDRWAYLNTGTGWGRWVRFYGNLELTTNPNRDRLLVQAAGRSRPIALFGDSDTLEVSGKAVVLPDEGSTVQEIENFLLTAGRVCYRDPSGRRMFGSVTGKVSGWTGIKADFDYTVSEAQ